MAIDPKKIAHHIASGFTYDNGQLLCGDQPVKSIAERFGTPLYLYNIDEMVAGYRRYAEALSALDHQTCYAVKANSSLALLRALIDAGCGMDVNSRGELFRALKAGAKPEAITMTGVGKSREDIEDALDAGILLLNAESVEECLRIDAIAKEKGLKAQVVLRINPDVDAHTHPYIATGLAEHKFGLGIEEAHAAIPVLVELGNVELVGFGMHLGSQIFDPHTHAEGLSKLADFILTLDLDVRAKLRYVNIGGGIGVPYRESEGSIPFDDFVSRLQRLLDDSHLNVKILTEPGRYLAAGSGILVTKVEYVKSNAERTFVILDGGMNDLLRPALYDAYHEIHPVELHASRQVSSVEIVGPICESGDTFARGRRMQEVREGEYVAIFSAGAYGATMSSRYNSKPLAAEAALIGGEAILIRERETLEDMVRKELLP